MNSLWALHKYICINIWRLSIMSIIIRGNNVRKTVKLFEVFRTTTSDNNNTPDENNQNMFVVGFIIGDEAIIR